MRTSIRGIVPVRTEDLRSYGDRSGMCQYDSSMTLESTSLDSAAGAFSALGDPIRLQVLDALRDGERCVCDLRDEVDVAPPLLSYHLKVLREAGLVLATKRGRWVDYRLAGGALTALRDLIPGADG